MGSGGFKGNPLGGGVEIGYEIARVFRNRGLATEAVEGMISLAFSFPEIEISSCK